MKKRNGFTLIELILCMTILAIASVIGFSSFHTVQIKARDTIRKEELNKIQVGLELYRQKKGHYPLVPPFACSAAQHKTDTSLTCALNMDWYYSTATFLPGYPIWIVGLDSSYISSVPMDPINNDHSSINSNNAWAFRYKTDNYQGCPGDGNWYALTANLENPSDSEAVGNKNVMWCDGTILNGNQGYIFKNTYLIVHKS